MQSIQTLRSLASVDRDLMEERVRQFVRHRQNGDFQRVMRLLSDHVVQVIPGDVAVVRCFGRHSGREAVQALLQTFSIEYQVIAMDVLDMMIDGDRVAVQEFWSLRHRGTGVFREVQASEIFRFEDGLIVEIVSYADTLAIAELTGASFRAR